MESKTRDTQQPASPVQQSENRWHAINDDQLQAKLAESSSPSASDTRYQTSRMSSTKTSPGHAHLIKALNSGSTMLLESPSTGRAKCRAETCLVQSLGGQNDNYIQGRWRICLHRTKNNDKPINQYYHATCLQAIGLDMPKYLDLEAEISVEPIPMPPLGISYGFMSSSTTMPVTFYEWSLHGGKTFNSDQYGEFEKDLKKYREEAIREIQEQWDSKRRSDLIVVASKRPQSTDYIQGEPVERSLTELLLDHMGVGPLKDILTEKDRIQILECAGGRARLKALLDTIEAESTPQQQSESDDIDATA